MAWPPPGPVAALQPQEQAVQARQVRAPVRGGRGRSAWAGGARAGRASQRQRAAPAALWAPRWAGGHLESAPGKAEEATGALRPRVTVSGRPQGEASG
ncbi:MAG: hypothetical protein QN130_05375 [Armatimonadota bacterium]|nr:hypothetical protein [Armatimonadota bacterium]